MYIFWLQKSLQNAGGYWGLIEFIQLKSGEESGVKIRNR